MWRRALLYRRQQSVPVRFSEQALYELALPTVAHRLEYAHLSTAARRIEYRYPLLDAELVSFYLAVPSHLKYWRGMGRYLFRRSLDQWVPDAVRWETGRRASANPGSVRRLQQDHAAMMARIHALPADHPVFRYVDLEKLSERVRKQGRFPRERRTELLMALMLAQKLSSTRPTPPVQSNALQ
jgi:asparagine synthetase B (glutamine-hydrolysing)